MFRFLVSGLLLFCLQLSAQEDNCLRQIDYTVEKSISFGLISEAESVDYSSLNLSRFEPFSTTYHFSMCVDQDGNFTSEKIFDSPAYQGDVWSTRIFRIRNVQGVISLFDENGLQVFNNSPDENGMNAVSPLTSEEIQWLELEHRISLPSQEEIELIKSEGMNVYQLSDNEVIIKGQNIEWTLNDLLQTMLIEEFEDGRLVASNYVKVLPINDSTAVPIYRVEETYESMKEGLIKVSTVKYIYSQYTIDGVLLSSNDAGSYMKGNPVKESFITQHDDIGALMPSSELMISPNPSISSVDMRLPFPDTDTPMEVRNY